MNEKVIDQVMRVLNNIESICFAYVHGSFLSSSRPGDIDVAVYLYEKAFHEICSAQSESLDFAIPLEKQIETAVHMTADVQVLNRAPLPFRARVVHDGCVIIDRNPGLRADFEYISRYEYFDFRPRRREYIAEALV